MMIDAAFRVVLDACVLYPFTLRDTLLRCAAAEFFQLYWSDEILDEMRRNLVRERITEEQADRLLHAMTSAFPEAMIRGHESMIAAMQNDEKDRHVAAAAVMCGAQIIVTDNTKDFTPLPEGIEAQTADEFLQNQFDLGPDQIVELLREQAAALKNPPRSFDELLTGLGRSTPGFVEIVREYAT